MIGVYLHVPFCLSKCPYCDFYSLAGAGEAEKDAYAAAVKRVLATAPVTGADTLYFGGGTPSLLGGKRIAALIDTVRDTVGLTSDAEITLEANPGDPLDELFAAFAAAGGNRVSLGAQAADDRALASLGRRHTVADTVRATDAAHKAGLYNLSLDLMLATPGQTVGDIRKAVRLFDELGAVHLSAYLLKLEPATPFGKDPPPLPDEDGAADRYLAAAEALAERGFAQYEISNFAKPGRQSRHNLKYWDQQPYWGIGPAAHSFLNGKRFYYPRSLTAFLNGEPPLFEPDGEYPAGSAAEYALLRLRLTEGLTEAGFYERFGTAVPAVYKKRAAALPRTLVQTDGDGIRLTAQGFLVSNAIIANILEG